jgi:hypothetical protein
MSSMSHLGQNTKYSSRVDVFRFAPELGHRSIQSACLKRAKSRSRDCEAVSLTAERYVLGAEAKNDKTLIWMIAILGAIGAL